MLEKNIYYLSSIINSSFLKKKILQQTIEQMQLPDENANKILGQARKKTQQLKRDCGK